MATSQPSHHMDTSQRINHVFGCDGQTMHVTPGFKLLQSGNLEKCPTCGAVVKDITDTPVGQSYLAFGRFDLGDLPS
jgi:uncharacterized paraquat-inducible protein A